MTPATKKYKKEAEEAENRARVAQLELSRLKEQQKKEAEQKGKNWSAIVYCSNCLEVNAVTIPPSNTALADGDCVVCRKRGCLHLVRKVNCGMTL